MMNAFRFFLSNHCQKQFILLICYVLLYARNVQFSRNYKVKNKTKFVLRLFRRLSKAYYA